MTILQRNKKKATAIGIAAAAVAAIAIGGGTYAAFNATAPGPGGTLASGHMGVSVSNPEASGTLFSATGIAPGYTSGLKSFDITNTGDIDGVLTGSFSVSGGSELASQLEVTGGCGTPYVLPPGTSALALTSFAQAFTGLNLPAGQSLHCGFTFTFKDLPGDANNSAQGQSVAVGSTFKLTQKPGVTQAH